LTPSRSEPAAIIRPDRANLFQKRHPWVFSGAIQYFEGSPTDGQIVALRDAAGQFYGRGYYNQRSQITVHVLTWEDQPIDQDFWRGYLQRAIQARRGEFERGDSPPAFRLINAESNGLPGLIVDRYGEWLVLQALTVGIDQRKAEIAALLMALIPDVRGVYERSDADVRAKEGLPPSVGLIQGEEPPALITIEEYGLRFQVDVRAGHKTGFYLDQRENRRILRESVREFRLEGGSVLNCFSYTGAFGAAAWAGGAGSVMQVDSSAEALVLAQQNMSLNGFAVRDQDFITGDVFRVLRNFREQGQQFDLIVLDPPKFASSKGQVERAARGYKDINWLAFQLIRPGGLLFTFSCSGLVDADLFQKIVFGALVDAHREASILRRLTAPPDHPVALTFPEGFYLKGLVCQVW